jgi:hypothetical protein
MGIQQQAQDFHQPAQRFSEQPRVRRFAEPTRIAAEPASAPLTPPPPSLLGRTIVNDRVMATASES